MFPGSGGVHEEQRLPFALCARWKQRGDAASNQISDTRYKNWHCSNVSMKCVTKKKKKLLCRVRLMPSPCSSCVYTHMCVHQFWLVASKAMPLTSVCFVTWMYQTDFVFPTCCAYKYIKELSGPNKSALRSRRLNLYSALLGLSWWGCLGFFWVCF